MKNSDRFRLSLRLFVFVAISAFAWSVHADDCLDDKRLSSIVNQVERAEKEVQKPGSDVSQVAQQVAESVLKECEIKNISHGSRREIQSYIESRLLESQRRKNPALFHLDPSEADTGVSSSIESVRERQRANLGGSLGLSSSMGKSESGQASLQKGADPMMGSCNFDSPSVRYKELFRLLQVMSYLAQRGSSEPSSSVSHSFIDVSSFEVGKDIDPSGRLLDRGVIRILKNEGLLKDTLFTPGSLTPKKGSVRLIHSSGATDVTQVQVKRGYVDPSLNDKSPYGMNSFIQPFIIKWFSGDATAEIRNLSEVKNSPLARLPLRDPAFPIITLDESIRCYMVSGKAKCFSILHSAQGQDLRSIIGSVIRPVLEADGKVVLDPTHESYKRAVEAVKHLGLGMASVHYRFADNEFLPIDDIVTYTHGDLHGENVLYDAIRKRIYFVDNETFAESLHEKRRVDVDIEPVLQEILEMAGSYPELRYFSSVLIQSFIDGYSSAFPSIKRDEIRLHIMSMARQILSTFGIKN